MQNSNKSDFNKRIYISAFIILLCFSLLTVRLFWIDFIKREEYSKAAINQRQKEVRISLPRGMIYDRNLIPLANRIKQHTMYIYKDAVKNNSKLQDYLRVNSKLPVEDLIKHFNSTKTIIEIPLIEEYSELEGELDGVFITDKILRYDEKNILSHVIGYVQKSNHRGVSGIEFGYDNVLMMDEVNGLVSLTVDGKERVIPGIGVTQVYSNNKIKTNSVQLTIDYHIQKAVEEIIDENNRNGAVVVTDVQNGDIVAMASRPNFNPNNISEYTNSDDMNLYNKAINVSYPPGSIFKIVVLLAALENNLVDIDEVFFCKGYEEVYGKTFECHNKEGHGEINLEEGFAKSCNSVFIQLGKRLGGAKIIEAAKKLGFGSKINFGPLEQKAGTLPDGDELLGAAIGNISIGQGKIEVTPLQVSNMMMILANNGVKKDLSIIKGIVTEEGVMVKPWKKDENTRVVSQSSCSVLRNFMEKVITIGTARDIKLDNIGGAAGKTGSAQAGVNNEIVHGWFSGYFPIKNPRYVITVFVEEGGSGGKSAAPIFEKIAEKIDALGK